MSKNGNDNHQQPIEGEVIPAHPTPRKQIRLSSIKDCRRELTKVYADARHGSVDPQDATRLTYILVAISNMIKDHELEERVNKLEEQNEKSGTKNRHT
ncbi:MAG: hypothetical protein ABTQ25_17030 [Nitrosomonas ureae]